jgi:hypothetical protein
VEYWVVEFVVEIARRRRSTAERPGQVEDRK